MPFKIGWEKVDARVVDFRLHKLVVQNGDAGSYNHEICDYIVQFAGSDGGQKRLMIRQNASRLNLPPASQPVPILVNKKRTKAAFDLDGTSIDAIGNYKKQTAADKASADARFKRKLG